MFGLFVPFLRAVKKTVGVVCDFVMVDAGRWGSPINNPLRGPAPYELDGVKKSAVEIAVDGQHPVRATYKQYPVNTGQQLPVVQEFA